MTRNALQNLIDSLGSGGYESYWEYDADFFLLFYERFKTTPFQDVPDVPFLFMELNNWQGMSQRCGVWQYYESGSFEPGKFERVTALLNALGEEEIASVYAVGIHDYANPKYQENGEAYPEEWLDADETVDRWIFEQEKRLIRWFYDWIMTHKTEVLEFGTADA